MYLKEEEQKEEKNSLYQTKKNLTNILTNSSNNTKNKTDIIILRKYAEISMLFNTGIWFRSASISLVIGENIFSDCNFEKCRFLITTKGIKKKPERNQLKRRVREHIRSIYPSIVLSQKQNKKGKFRDIALIASNSNISFTELGNEIYVLLQQANIINKINRA